jgi:hypothetical protein
MFIIIIAASFTVVSMAMAEVANRYGGRVLLFSKRPPSRWANDGVFHRFVNQHKINSVDENDEGEWRVEYMAFFRRAVNDREVTVRFYNAGDASGRYLTSYTLYLNDLRQRIVGGNVTLERPDFQPNRYYKITVANRGKTLAQLTKFALTGQEVKRSGEVNFSVEDTRGP